MKCSLIKAYHVFFLPLVTRQKKVVFEIQGFLANIQDTLK